MSDTTTAATQAIFWGLILIIAIAVLGLFVWLVRRWVFKADQQARDEGWSLQHLRELKANGQLSDDEYEALKAKIVENARAGLEDGESASDSRRIDAKKR